VGLEVLCGLVISSCGGQPQRLHAELLDQRRGHHRLAATVGATRIGAGQAAITFCTARCW
jgi:hypothetical protein